MKLNIVEQIHEGEQGDWLYRFRSNKNGVIVRRVEKNHPIWSHAVLVQMFDRKAGAFLPSNVCGSDVYFATLAEAMQATIEE